MNTEPTKSSENAQTTPAQVCELVADALGLDYDEVTADSNMDSVAGWDSLQHLSVISAIETDFELVVGPDDVADLNSVAAIVAFVTSAAKAANG